MKVLLISQYAEELLNNKVPQNPLLLIHYKNYHRNLYQTLVEIGHDVTVTDGLNVVILDELVRETDLIFPIRNYYGYNNGDILVRLLGQKYDKKLIGGSAYLRFYESDKIIGKLLAMKLGIPTPKFAMPYDVSNISFDGPYILKPRFTGSSMNLSDDNIFYSKETLINHIYSLNCSVDYYVEKYLYGKTITMGCLKGINNEFIMGEPYILTSKNHKVITYEDKRNGGCVRSYVDNPNIVENISNFCRMLFNEMQPCQMARYDFMLSNNQLYFLETNFMPNLSETGGFVQLYLRNVFGSYKTFVEYLINSAISSNKQGI